MKLAVLTCTLVLTACAAPVSDTSTGRRLAMDYRLGGGLSFAAVEPGVYDRFHGEQRYTVRWGDDGSPLAEVNLRVSAPNRTPSFSFQIIGAQRVRVPIGQRYLDEEHFTDWAVEGKIDGQAYAGPVTVESLHFDLMDGTIYVTLDVDLQPVDHSGPAYAGRIEGEGIDGYIPLSCFPPEAPRGRTDDEMRAEYCDPIREAIAETPDDPGAPPPPWDPHGDVIVCIEGDDCGGSTPVPPPD